MAILGTFTPAAILWRYSLVQTHADFRLGTLVRWNAGKTGEPDDVDDLGIVIQLPEDSAYYYIAWSVTNTTSHHSPDMVEESLYQRQMEIVG
jgi:hypothetical protein